MARRSSCKCCGHPSARAHHGGFAVCIACTVVESERVAEGPVRTEGNKTRDAKYRVYEYRCGGAICNKKSFLGSTTRVIEWKS